MRSLDCKERVEAYFNNMAKYEKDIVIHVRFLDKIFHAAMDNYTNEEKLWILDKLIDTASKEKELTYEVLDFVYAYRINKIGSMGRDSDIEIIKLDDVLEATPCSDGVDVPEPIMNYLKNRPGQTTLKFIESLESDKEILDLYNVKIAKDHFVYRG